VAPPTNTQQQFRNQITDSTKQLLGMLGKQIVFKLTFKLFFLPLAAFWIWKSSELQTNFSLFSLQG
jgi:hypothetical protein